MSISPFDRLTCPLDGEPLVCSAGGWTCASGHCFDIAREGYVNLLPVQHKRSLDPGDSKAMVAARRRFLNAGLYAPIAHSVARLTLAGEDTALACLDAGCGEGYYLRQLAVTAGPRPLAVLGLDISKWAVQTAARLDAHVAWVVGTNAKLPVPDASLDRILCLFGFPVAAEFARALKPGGLLIQADAGSDHLRELREVIYPIIKPERSSGPEAPAGFALQHTETLRYETRLADQAAIGDLLLMTPHLFRATAEGRARAAALQSLAITVDVRLAVCRRA